MQRSKYLAQIQLQLRVHPVCALLGPRQVGKTTLARLFLQQHPQERVLFLDMENPLHLARLDNPMLALAKYTDHLIVIDEIQLRPDLFPLLRVLVDEPAARRKFLLLGSASRDLIRQSSETLAGRIGYIEVTPFALDEVENCQQLWLRGGFPRSYLAAEEEESLLWRQAYIQTFLERDIPQLGFQIVPQQMRRFWMMLAHYHGQIFNASELGCSLCVSSHTVRNYLAILAGTFMVRILTPWFENLGKRQVKSPKIYFRDSGLLHALMGIPNEKALDFHPKLGALWEGFALEQVISLLRVGPEECYFWAKASGAELDLLLFYKGRRLGFECKYCDAPKVTASMQISLKALQLDHLFVIFPGHESFPLTEQITAQGLAACHQLEAIIG